MGQHFKQKEITVHHGGRTLNTVVIANRSTSQLHPASTAFLLDKRLSNVQVSSCRKYGSIVLSLIEEVCFDSQLSDFDDLTDAHMTAYLEKVLYRERNVEPGTINQHVSTLSEFFTFLYDNGWVKKPNRFTFHTDLDLAHKMDKSSGRLRSLDPYRLPERYIPKEDFDCLLSYESSKSIFVRERNEIILRLGYESGLRAAETVSFDNFKVSSIKDAITEAEKKGVHELDLAIRGKGSGAGKARRIDINPTLRRKIESYIKAYSSTIGNQLITSTKGLELDSEHASVIFRRAKENIVSKAPLEIADRWSKNNRWQFHSCRHSYATNLSKLIVDKKVSLPKIYVQERLGHNDPRTTLIYIHFAALLMNDIEKADEVANTILQSSKEPIADEN